MKKLPHIGRIELVSLQDEAVQDVPAKIDTGADSSSVWASSINEKKGVLSFTLFGPGSPYYTGKIITRDKFTTRAVKNSFGVSEFRYRITMDVVINGQRITTFVNLSNRANNRYPILIGRRTLQGNFLVDVSRKPKQDEYHILMLSTKHTAPTAAFAKSIEKQGKKLRVTYGTYADLCIYTGRSNRILHIPSGRDIASYDLVYFKTTSKYPDIAAATAQYLEKRGVHFIDDAIKYFSLSSKMYQYIILADNSIAVPQSVFLLPEKLKGSYDLFESELGLPFILKDIHGNKGEHNYLVRDKKSFNKAIKKATKETVQCVAQAFIPNDGDYRVLVFGSRINLVIKRTRAHDKTHLNNTSQGAQAEIVDAKVFPAAVRNDCVRAAKLIQRQVAGVDIVKDKVSGLWYCLEVNDGPQLATGSFTKEKHAAFAAYLGRKLSK